MNKVKKFEISVVDRTYSKVVSNLVKFYSSDSALEVIFILAEEGYEFDSAELVLSNTDGSLITRPLTKVPEGYSYEFEKNISSHHGEWKGQVILTSGNDTYVSSKIAITIEDDLLGERPPKLTDVYSWTSLKRYADDLIDELKQAVLEVEGMGDIFNANELERQATFESNESERNQTFESNEDIRQSQELERDKAESQRQTIFDGNEATRYGTFNANEATRQENETTRQQAETQRTTAESSRASAEEQREIDHENRSAELDGKADKKQEGWITPTLLNGATGTLQYRKNNFGRVEFKGDITHANAGFTAFVSLPNGYKMPSVGRIPVVSFDSVVGNIATLSSQNLGTLYLTSALKDKVVSLNGVTFEGN